MLHTLILAYGNTLRGDDGAGPAAAERLLAVVKDPEVEIHILHQLTPELAEPISLAARVIFIDASADAAPGEVVERAIQPSGVRARFTHHSTPEALLAGARALYGRAPEATVITIGGADFSLSSGLSPVVQSAIDRVILTTLNLLAHKS